MNTCKLYIIRKVLQKIPINEIEIVCPYCNDHEDKRFRNLMPCALVEMYLTFLRNVGKYLPDYATSDSSTDEM